MLIHHLKKLKSTTIYPDLVGNDFSETISPPIPHVLPKYLYLLKLLLYSQTKKLSSIHSYNLQHSTHYIKLRFLHAVKIFSNLPGLNLNPSSPRTVTLTSSDNSTPRCYIKFRDIYPHRVGST